VYSRPAVCTRASECCYRGRTQPALQPGQKVDSGGPEAYSRGGNSANASERNRHLKLDLKPGIEAGLLAQAQARGLSLEAYLDEVLEQAAHRPEGADRSQPEIDAPAQSSERPIWEVIADIMKDVPDEVFDRLPKDGANQIDHYIYGLPKRE
jgi:hypothetical protein